MRIGQFENGDFEEVVDKLLDFDTDLLIDENKVCKTCLNAFNVDNRSGNFRRSSFKCEVCGRSGHLAKYYLFKSEDKSDGSSSSRSGSHSFKSSSNYKKIKPNKGNFKIKCFKCDKSGHIKSNGFSVDSVNDNESKSDSAELNPFYLEANSATESNKLKFKIDTSASDYFIASDSFFSYSEELFEASDRKYSSRR